MTLGKINSLQNSKVKLVHRLRTKRGREQKQQFIIEYQRDLERAIDQRYQIDFIMFCPSIADESILRLVSDARVYEISEQILKKVSYRENAVGWIAIMQSKPRLGLADLEARDINQVLGLVDLRKPGNIGALLRTADAAGFDAILLVDTRLDLYNPNIIRSSTGTCFLDNIYHMDSKSALEYCRSHHFQIISAHVGGDKTPYEVDFSQNTAIVLGTEDIGLIQQWIISSDQLVKIPMFGNISDSLNVSVSGAIMMYEALRQRKFS